jgi:hypothetical protein
MVRKNTNLFIKSITYQQFISNFLKSQIFCKIDQVFVPLKSHNMIGFQHLVVLFTFIAIK